VRAGLVAGVQTCHPQLAFARLFPNAKDRAAFAKTKESGQIDQFIDSLPEPPTSPQTREYSGKFNVRVPKSLHAALASEAEAEGRSEERRVGNGKVGGGAR